MCRSSLCFQPDCLIDVDLPLLKIRDSITIRSTKIPKSWKQHGQIGCSIAGIRDREIPEIKGSKVKANGILSVRLGSKYRDLTCVNTKSQVLQIWTKVNGIRHDSVEWGYFCVRESFSSLACTSTLSSTAAANFHLNYPSTQSQLARVYHSHYELLQEMQSPIEPEFCAYVTKTSLFRGFGPVC